MIKAVIVEDDPMVLSINQKYLEKDGRVKVVKTFSNGKDAFAYLSEFDVDLMLLDVYMPGLTGLELLKKIRRNQLPTEVIMITAANDVSSLDAALKLGVIDYLVKPFTYDRLQEAVGKYINKRRMLIEQTKEALSQREIDKLMGQSSGEGTADGGSLEKGYQKRTLERIEGFFHDRKGGAYTSEEVAKEIGLSRVTVKRYLDHMVSMGLIQSEIDYETGGRPRIRYY